MNTYMLRHSKLVAISFAVAGSIGLGLQAAHADTFEVPVTLNGDVVKFVETNSGASVDAAGNIVDPSGDIIGVVYGPDGKVVHEVVGDKMVIVKERGDKILSASLYNRMADLQNLLNNEKALGHISIAKFDKLNADLNDARGDLDIKVAANGILSFPQSLEIGADLDTIASRIKSDLSTTAYSEIIFKPMVVVKDPAKKRITIYQRAVKTSDGVTRTTKTTTTETTQ